MKNKIIISVLSLIIVMLIIPVGVVNFAPEDAGMALCFILFFIINPIFITVLSVISAFDVRNLWWIPILSAIVFPFFFWIAVKEVVKELFFYSIVYLLIGVLAMLATYVWKKYFYKKS